MTWRPFEPPIVPAERHQHENVLDTLRTGDAYNLREAIRQDLLEGGTWCATWRRWSGPG